MNNQYDDQVIKARDVTSSPVQSQRGTDERERLAHFSDCAVHNEPAFPAGECNCGVGERIRIIEGIRLDSQQGIVPGLYYDIAQRLEDAYLQERADAEQLRALETRISNDDILLTEFREQLRARDEEIAGLRKAVTLARNTFEGYAALHREKGTPDGDAKAALNQDLSARMNAALQEKSRAAG